MLVVWGTETYFVNNFISLVESVILIILGKVIIRYS